MPSSRCNHIPVIVGLVRELKPESILDVGVGFGKWGHLFREYTDIVMSEHEPKRYRRENWKVRIDGIEGFEPYITDAHRYLYNQIFIGDMRAKIREVGQYDIIFLGDVIEHVPKEQGFQLLRDCMARARKAVIVSTPATEIAQEAVCANELEVHRSSWEAHDFAKLGRSLSVITENDILVAALMSQGVDEHRLRLVVLSGRRRPSLRRALRENLPWLRPIVRKVRGVRRPAAKPAPSERFPGSGSYWEQRYQEGGNSGVGSYGRLAEFKAKVINEFIAARGVESAIEFGSGDGNQLSLLKVPAYTGVDVSPTAVARLKERFGGDNTKRFLVYEPLKGTPEDVTATLGLSLDVIYHLVEDDVFDRYMRDLFAASKRYVIVYSSNHNATTASAHVRDRKFSDFIDANLRDWKLISHIENPYKEESRASFYIYERSGA